VLPACDSHRIRRTMTYVATACGVGGFTRWRDSLEYPAAVIAPRDCKITMGRSSSSKSSNESSSAAVDPALFHSLVNQYYEDLYRFALSLAKSQSDAADLTQETFLVFASKGNQLRDPAKAKSWLFTTLYHEFLRRRRKDQRLVFTEESEPFDGDGGERTPSQDVDSRMVVDALASLDESHRAPLTLFYLQGYAYREIAEILELPIGTVMSRLSRAKAALRKALANPKLGEQLAAQREPQSGGDVVPMPKPRKRSGGGH